MIEISNSASRLLPLMLAIIAISSGASAETVVAPREAAILHLRDGDFIAGQLVDCVEPGVIRWQMRGATRPFNLQASALHAVYFPAPALAAAAIGEFIVELTDGDLLFGSLVNVTPEEFIFDSAGFGQLRVDRSEIRRISAAGDAATSEYRGPNGLADWKASNPQQWRDEAGRLITNVPYAKVEKELALPQRARVQFEIAWRDKPEFVLSLAAGASDAEIQEGFRFEVWQNALVAIRALGDHADVDIVCQLDSNDKRVQLEALIDQEQGSMIFCGLDGKQIAEIEVAPMHAKHGKSLTHITVVNGRSELRLERLAVSRWSGLLPPQMEADVPGLLQTDGTIQYRSVVGYDSVARQFTLTGGEGGEEEEERRISADQVACIFPTPGAVSSGYVYRVALHDGSRMSGELSKVVDGKVFLTRRGIEQPVTCSVDQIRSLVAAHKTSQPPAIVGRMGRLEIDGVQLHGSLSAGPTEAVDADAFLMWLPRWSATGSPLEPDVSGRIVYRDRPPPAPKIGPREQQRLDRIRQMRQRRAQPAGFWAQMWKAFEPNTENVTTLPKQTGTGTIHMLSGDRVPYDSVEIDEMGVRFKSSFVDATFVPHSEVKAIELVPNWSAAALAEAKRQRLLTLPRMQKPNPPTHLVASKGGDFLRARLTSMTADNLQIESRLEEKQVPRDRVACIIWLHNDVEIGDRVPGKSLPGKLAGQPRVQAVHADGAMLTFVPRECSGRELLGTSELLGPCRVSLEAIDLLNLGKTIDRLADEQPFHQWTLSDSIEPSYLREDGEAAGGAAGAATATNLIGKAAPDVRLNLLDGTPFQLADHKGHIVVLDFWASWCGPCMQAMPAVDSVVDEFADRGVKLFAINLQEDSAAAMSAIERLGIDVTVALDVDGAFAEHYQVTAIPQTVVINAEGIVEQLFVGASPELAGELRGDVGWFAEGTGRPIVVPFTTNGDLRWRFLPTTDHRAPQLLPSGFS